MVLNLTQDWNCKHVLFGAFREEPDLRVDLIIFTVLRIGLLLCELVESKALLDFIPIDLDELLVLVLITVLVLFSRKQCGRCVRRQHLHLGCSPLNDIAVVIDEADASVVVVEHFLDFGCESWTTQFFLLLLLLLPLLDVSSQLRLLCVHLAHSTCSLGSSLSCFPVRIQLVSIVFLLLFLFAFFAVASIQHAVFLLCVLNNGVRR